MLKLIMRHTESTEGIKNVLRAELLYLLKIIIDLEDGSECL